MTHAHADQSPSFFKDKHGHIVLSQMPNIPLGIWLVTKLISLLVHAGKFKSGLEHVGMAFLFVWAYLELRHGVNYFRRLLGALVLLALILDYFH